MANEVFAKRIEELRKQRNLTQEEIAEVMGVRRQAVSQYCNGVTVPTIDKLEKLADYFDVSADYLLGLQDVPKNPPIRSGADIAYASDITGLPPSLIIALKSMKDTSTFCIGKITNNYILIDIGKRVLNVETDA